MVVEEDMLDAVVVVMMTGLRVDDDGIGWMDGWTVARFLFCCYEGEE